MLQRGQSYVQLRSIYNLFWKPRALLQGRINRGVGGIPLLRVDLMRRRQRIESSWYSPVPNPTDAAIISMEELKDVEG